jgi:putative transposase
MTGCPLSIFPIGQRTMISVPTSTISPNALHKLFPQSLNVVIMVKTHLKTHAWAHVILFSSDLTVSAEQIIDDYQLRFQLEFNRR